MQNPRETRTNAADSAPGVDDGPVRGKGAPVDSKPSGRKTVWLLVAASVVLLLVILVAKPMQTGRGASPPVNAPAGEQAMVGPAMSAAEIEGSTVPGAADDGRPAQP
ncbi:hypothetical protein [Phenylobacterium sp.]|uniref:hypothetical protein n=1 Tax=Phenylobacterium sp. TaxID=1871053 RepID=UPI002B72BF4C|nr:hypothetical protein [Phenylobacterium sp.]HVI32590.1 hypothetical protein [Phenylobacterium sp.]